MRRIITLRLVLAIICILTQLTLILLCSCTLNAVDKLSELTNPALIESVCVDETNLSLQYEAPSYYDLVLWEPSTKGPYRLYYGEWIVKDVISQHLRLGGDEGYEDLLNMNIYYDESTFKNSLGMLTQNPAYDISIIPYNEFSNQFFPEQWLNEWLQDTNYFAFVQIINVKNGVDDSFYEKAGSEFVVVDDNTLIMFAYNCLYRLERVSSTRNGYGLADFTYQER